MSPSPKKEILSITGSGKVIAAGLAMALAAGFYTILNGIADAATNPPSLGEGLVIR